MRPDVAEINEGHVDPLAKTDAQGDGKTTAGWTQNVDCGWRLCSSSETDQTTMTGLTTRGWWVNRWTLVTRPCPKTEL